MYMPESETELIDYYPSGWTEEIHEERYIEWVYDDDPAVFVRLDGTMGERYSVTPITGVNDQGEEFVTRPLNRLSEEAAFDAAATLVYAINGAIGRISGDEQFNGDA
jgi:hypothetical protein